MLRDVKIGQVVYIHEKKSNEPDYVENLTEFQVKDIIENRMYLEATEDNTIKALMRVRNGNFVNADCTKTTLYRSLDEFINKKTNYEHELNRKSFKNKINEKIESLSYEEIKVLEKLLNIQYEEEIK